MKVNLYTASVPVFRLGLTGLAAVLRKAVAHAEAHRLAPPDLLRARLYPDMFPLYRQVQIVCDFARQAPSRIAGLEVPPDLEGEPGFAELQDLIAQSQQFLDRLSPAQFEDRDDVRVSFPAGGDTMVLPAAQYLQAFALQNFFFHYVTAYAILRMTGVALGKRDYFGFPASD